MNASRGRRRRTTEYDRNRAEIIDIAAGLFAERGYAGTGVAEIGEAAQLARGALYYYIQSKEALLEEIHDRVMVPLLRDAESILELDADVLVRLRLLSESLLAQIIERQTHVWVFLHEYRALQGERREHFREQRQRFEGIIAQLLQEGIKEGRLVVSDVRLATLSFLGMHNYTYQWVRSEDPIEPATLSDFYCRTLLVGMAAADIDFRALDRDVEQARKALAAAPPPTAAAAEGDDTSAA